MSAEDVVLLIAGIGLAVLGLAGLMFRRATDRYLRASLGKAARSFTTNGLRTAEADVQQIQRVLRFALPLFAVFIGVVFVVTSLAG